MLPPLLLAHWIEPLGRGVKLPPPPGPLDRTLIVQEGQSDSFNYWTVTRKGVGNREAREAMASPLFEP